MDRLPLPERRAQILRVAAAEFARTGLHGTTAEVIARRAGISQPYVFRLFTTKKGLFIEVIQDSFDKIISSFDEAAEGQSGTDALYAMGLRYRSLLQDRTFLLIQLQGFAACADPEVRETVRRGYTRMWETLQKHSGADNATVKRFLALGMMLNGMVAMDLQDSDDPFAQAFLTPLPLDEFLGIPIRTPGRDEV